MLLLSIFTIIDHHLLLITCSSAFILAKMQCSVTIDQLESILIHSYHWLGCLLLGVFFSSNSSLSPSSTFSDNLGSLTGKLQRPCCDIVDALADWTVVRRSDACADVRMFDGLESSENTLGLMRYTSDGLAFAVKLHADWNFWNSIGWR